ncbi:MAG: hypothetical protein K8H86_02420 [Ignavibacteriaceae bacterium]|nr:hypothetical protein [Ignavibacteriaceae bacterium]
MKNIKTLSALFVIFFAALLFGQTSEEAINQADELSKQQKHDEEINILLAAEKQDPQNFEILWRISRGYVDIGEHMPEKTDDQKDAQSNVYKKALDYAEKSVKAGSDKSVTYLRRAIANGRIALFKGVFSVAPIVNSVKSDCEKALKLNNSGTYHDALAHYILGRTHAKLAEKWAPARAVLGLGWGDLQVGIQEYLKAIKIKPNFRMFHLDLAKAYIEDDQYDNAKEQLKKVISSPAEDEDDGERVVEAKKLFEEIKNE